jgi:hypothetical protein
MKEFSEIMSLKRRVEQRVQQMNSDPVFRMVDSKELQEINSKQLIETLDIIIKNYPVLKWLIDGNVSIEEMVNSTL